MRLAESIQLLGDLRDLGRNFGELNVALAHIGAGFSKSFVTLLLKLRADRIEFVADIVDGLIKF